MKSHVNLHFDSQNYKREQKWGSNFNFNIKDKSIEENIFIHK